MLALSTTCFAGTNDVLLKNLKNAVKSVESATTWTTTGSFKSAAFSFSGKQVKVYYDAEDNSLIGFSVKIGLDELPAGTTDNVQKKFSGWLFPIKLCLSTIPAGTTTMYRLQRVTLTLPLWFPQTARCIFQQNAITCQSGSYSATAIIFRKQKTAPVL